MGCITASTPHQTATTAIINNYQKDSYCSYCGSPFGAAERWPRQCRHCRNLTFRNPLPVTVVLLPVDDGVLVIRRANEPHQGEYALPGGFIETGESWQEAGAREVAEEASVSIRPQDLRELRVFSAHDNTLIICARGPKLCSVDLPPFRATPEASDRLILTHPRPLAFPLHTELVADYLAHNSCSSSTP